MGNEIRKQDLYDYLRKDNKRMSLDHRIENASLAEAKANLREIEKFRKIYCNSDPSILNQVAREAIEEAKDGISSGSELGTNLGLGVGFVVGLIGSHIAIIDMSDRGELDYIHSSEKYALALGLVFGWGAICAAFTMGGKIAGATTGGTIGLLSGGTHGIFSVCRMKQLDGEQMQMILSLEEKARVLLQKLETNSENKLGYGIA
jgi:hypothetical protein